MQLTADVTGLAVEVPCMTAKRDASARRSWQALEPGLYSSSEEILTLNRVRRVFYPREDAHPTVLRQLRPLPRAPSTKRELLLTHWDVLKHFTAND